MASTALQFTLAAATILGFLLCFYPEAAQAKYVRGELVTIRVRESGTEAPVQYIRDMLNKLNLKYSNVEIHSTIDHIIDFNTGVTRIELPLYTETVNKRTKLIPFDDSGDDDYESTFDELQEEYLTYDLIGDKTIFHNVPNKEKSNVDKESTQLSPHSTPADPLVNVSNHENNELQVNINAITLGDNFNNKSDIQINNGHGLQFRVVIPGDNFIYPNKSANQNNSGLGLQFRGVIAVDNSTYANESAKHINKGLLLIKGTIAGKNSTFLNQSVSDFPFGDESIFTTEESMMIAHHLNISESECLINLPNYYYWADIIILIFLMPFFGMVLVLCLCERKGLICMHHIGLRAWIYSKLNPQ